MKQLGSVLHDILDVNTGERLSYKKVTVFADSTPMTDANTDGVIYRKIGTEYFKRTFTGPLNVMWFGAKGDGTTDDAAAIQKALDVAGLISASLYLPKPPIYYRCSTGLNIKRFVRFYGQDSSESTFRKTIIRFDRKPEAYGIKVEEPTASGTILKGFRVDEAGTHNSGNIIEHNPDDNRLLYYRRTYALPLTDYETRQTAEANNAVTGTFTLTAEGERIGAKKTYHSLTGSFQVGQVITGQTSGATATVMFVSKLHHAILTKLHSGTIANGETFTSATGSAVQRSSADFTPEARVGTVTAVTGNLNALDSAGRPVLTFNTVGNYRTGILIRRRCILEDMSVAQFSGHGIKVTSRNDLGNDTFNANSFRILRTASGENGGNGLHIEGGDANAGTTDSCDFTGNAGLPLCDRSFLGCSHYNHHASINLAGGYDGGNYAIRRSVWVNCYTEGHPHRTPWYSGQTFLSGGNTSVSGVRGLPTDTAGGQDLSDNNFSSGTMRSYTGPRGGKMLSRTSNTTKNSTFAVEATGNAGEGVGVGMEFWGPWASGTSQEYVKLFATKFGGQNALQFLFKPTNTYTSSIANADGTPTPGTGFVSIVHISGGAVSSIEILSKGSGYLPGTKVRVMNVAAGSVEAELRPFVSYGKIETVDIVSAGSGYTDTAYVPFLEMSRSGESFRPAVDLQANVGQATRRFLNVYGQNLRTGAGGHLITSGTGSPEGIVSASPGSVYYQTDGLTGQKRWTKETGTGSTGWLNNTVASENTSGTSVNFTKNRNYGEAAPITSFTASITGAVRETVATVFMTGVAGRPAALGAAPYIVVSEPSAYDSTKKLLVLMRYINDAAVITTITQY